MNILMVLSTKTFPPDGQEIVSDIRTAEPIGLKGDYHPMFKPREGQ